MEYCLANGGDFILRIKNKPFHLYNRDHEKILLTDWLKTLDGGVSENIFYFLDSSKNFQPVRICAMPKTEEKIKAEEIKRKKKESKKQIKISGDTKFSHRYLFVATSLPETVTAKEILDIYRLRWQVEMVLKRYKSILGFGSIPTKTKESTQAWLEGKMMLALLVEKFLGNVNFPPLGKQEKNRSIWRETKLVFLFILMVIIPQDNLPFGQDFLHFSIRSFVEKRKKDQLQMATFSLS